MPGSRATPLATLGGFEIASPLAESHGPGTTIATIHTWLGGAFLWVAGGHALAAPYHRFVLKDGVLASMLPTWLMALPRAGGERDRRIR